MSRDIRKLNEERGSSDPSLCLKRNVPCAIASDSDSFHSVGKHRYLKAYFHLVSDRTFYVNVLPS